MDKSLMKSAVAVVVGAIVLYAAASLALPWAPVLFPSAGGYPAMQLAHTAVVVAISLPVALVLASRRLSLQAPVPVALCIAVLGLVLPVLPSVDLMFRPGWPGASAALDYLKFAGTLPLLTWLARRWLPSKNSPTPTPLRGAA